MDSAANFAPSRACICVMALYIYIYNLQYDY